MVITTVMEDNTIMDENTMEKFREKLQLTHAEHDACSGHNSNNGLAISFRICL